MSSDSQESAPPACTPHQPENTLGVFLGPDKSGSTWIYLMAKKHRQIEVARSKELFYFDRYYHLGDEWYESQFLGSRKVRFDISHDYLFSKAAARRLAAYSPDARLIVSLRHPLERALSVYAYMTSQGRIRLPPHQALRAVPELIDHGLYAKHLAEWLVFFDRNSLALLDFEELRANPRSFAERITTHLKVCSPGPEVYSHGPTNVARKARIPGLVRMGRLAAGALRRSGHPNIVQRIKDSPVINKAAFAPDSSGGGRSGVVLPHDLRSLLISDAERLDEMFNTSFKSLWWPDC